MVEDTIAELRNLLEEERQAILELDGARVFDLAGRKQSLALRLRDAKGPLSQADVSAFGALMPALRHNGVLLAHARDVLRDAVCVARAEHSATSACVLPSEGQRRTLSVRG